MFSNINRHIPRRRKRGRRRPGWRSDSYPLPLARRPDPTIQRSSILSIVAQDNRMRREEGANVEDVLQSDSYPGSDSEESCCWPQQYDRI